MFDHRGPYPSYPSSPENVRKPNPPDTWISDYGNFIDTRRTVALNRLLRQVNIDTGAEFAIVALNDLGLTHSYGYKPEAYGRFSQDLFDSWGIGRVDKDDGLLLVVFCKGRRVEIAVERAY